MRNKLVKIIGGCLLLVVLGGGVLLWRLDPILESFRPEIEKLLSAKVQQPVSIGKLSLKLFPSTTARISDVRLQGSDTPSVHELVLKVGLLPLISKRLEITEISLDGANLLIARLPSGEIKVNGVPIGGAKTASEPPPPEADASAKKSIAIEIKKAGLSNSEFHWHDEAVSPAQDLTFSNFNLELKDIKDNSVHEIEGSGQLLSNKAKNFSISGSFENNSGKADLKLESIDLKKLSSVIESYTKKPLPVALEEAADISAKLAFNPPELSIQGALNASAAAIRFAESFQKPKGDPLSLELQGKASLLGAVDISSLKGTLGKNHFEAPFSAVPLGDTKVHFKSDALVLGDLGQYLPFLATYRPGGELQIDVGAALGANGPKDLSGALVLKNISAGMPGSDAAQPPLLSALKGKVELAGNGISAKDISFALGGQPLDLTASVSSLSTPDIALTVRSSELKLDELVKSLTGKANPALQDAALKNLNLAAAYSVPKKTCSATCEFSGGTIASFPLSKTKLVVDALLSPSNELARATLQPSSISLFGGTATLNGALNEAGQISTVVQAAGIDMKQLLNVVNPGGKITMSGNLRSMTFKGSGPKQNFAGALNGSADAVVVKGAIEGFNLLAQTLGKMDQIPGLGAALLAFVPEEHRELLRRDSTPFNELTLQLQMSGKDIKINNLNMAHDTYILTGHGTIPASGDLNLDAQLRLTESLAAGMVKKEPKLRLLLDKNKSIVFPVIITRKGGIFLVLPDISNLGKRALENTARDAATKALDKVSPGLGNALDSLFR